MGEPAATDVDVELDISGDQQNRKTRHTTLPGPGAIRTCTPSSFPSPRPYPSFVPWRPSQSRLTSAMHALQRLFLGLAALHAGAVAAPPPPPNSGSETIADFRPAETFPDTSQTLPVLPAPTLSSTREGRQLRITFTGTLLSAPSVRGPWTALPGAISPYTFAPESPDARFFRAVDAPPIEEDLFASRSVIQCTLSGRFQPHFDLAFAGMPDGIFPPHREKPYFDGHVLLASQDITAEIRVRGNSSLQECPFPKLKLKVSREDRAGTPFETAREIKIGTHCADGGSGTVGRLRDQTATYREALAYEMVESLGFIGPKVRRARILYQDTSPTAEDGSGGGWSLERQAILLEDIEVVGERLGGRALDDAEVAALKDAHFDPQLVAHLRLVQVLLGNWDFALSETGENLWNIEVVSLPDGRLVPVTGDFDLATWVTGKVRLNAPPDFRPDLPDLERETTFQLSEVQKRISKAAFAQSREWFRNRRTAMAHIIQGADIDEPGRINAQRHLDAFFTALEGL